MGSGNTSMAFLLRGAKVPTGYPCVLLTPATFGELARPQHFDRRAKRSLESVHHCDCSRAGTKLRYQHGLRIDPPSGLGPLCAKGRVRMAAGCRGRRVTTPPPPLATLRIRVGSPGEPSSSRRLSGCLPPYMMVHERRLNHISWVALTIVSWKQEDSTRAGCSLSTVLAGGLFASASGLEGHPLRGGWVRKAPWRLPRRII